MGTMHLSQKQKDILDRTKCLIGLVGRTRAGHIVHCVADRRDTAGHTASCVLWVSNNALPSAVLLVLTSKYGRWASNGDEDRPEDIVEIIGETPARTVASQMCVAHARGLLDLTQWPEAREFITTFEPDVVFPPFQPQTPSQSPCA